MSEVFFKVQGLTLSTASLVLTMKSIVLVTSLLFTLMSLLVNSQLIDVATLDYLYIDKFLLTLAQALKDEGKKICKTLLTFSNIFLFRCLSSWMDAK